MVGRPAQVLMISVFAALFAVGLIFLRILALHRRLGPVPYLIVGRSAEFLLAFCVLGLGTKVFGRWGMIPLLGILVLFLGFGVFSYITMILDARTRILLSRRQLDACATVAGRLVKTSRSMLARAFWPFWSLSWAQGVFVGFAVEIERGRAIEALIRIRELHWGPFRDASAMDYVSCVLEAYVKTLEGSPKMTIELCREILGIREFDCHDFTFAVLNFALVLLGRKPHQVLAEDAHTSESWRWLGSSDVLFHYSPVMRAYMRTLVVLVEAEQLLQAGEPGPAISALSERKCPEWLRTRFRIPHLLDRARLVRAKAYCLLRQPDEARRELEKILHSPWWGDEARSLLSSMKE